MRFDHVCARSQDVKSPVSEDTGLSLFVFLLAFEGEKGYDARSFDGIGEFSLMHGADAAHSSGKDLAALGHIFFQAVTSL